MKSEITSTKKYKVSKLLLQKTGDATYKNGGNEIRFLIFFSKENRRVQRE